MLIVSTRWGALGGRGVWIILLRPSTHACLLKQPLHLTEEKSEPQGGHGLHPGPTVNQEERGFELWACTCWPMQVTAPQLITRWGSTFGRLLETTLL